MSLFFHLNAMLQVLGDTVKVVRHFHWLSRISSCLMGNFTIHGPSLGEDISFSDVVLWVFSSLICMVIVAQTSFNMSGDECSRMLMIVHVMVSRY